MGGKEKKDGQTPLHKILMYAILTIEFDCGLLNPSENYVG